MPKEGNIVAWGGRNWVERSFAGRADQVVKGLCRINGGVFSVSVLGGWCLQHELQDALLCSSSFARLSVFSWLDHTII